jgi:hypothetical protein
MDTNMDTNMDMDMDMDIDMDMKLDMDIWTGHSSIVLLLLSVRLSLGLHGTFTTQG